MRGLVALVVLDEESVAAAVLGEERCTDSSLAALVVLQPHEKGPRSYYDSREYGANKEIPRNGSDLVYITPSYFVLLLRCISTPVS